MHRKQQRVPLTISHRSGWRDYQAALKRTAASRKRHRRLFRAGCLLILTALAGWVAAGGLTGLKARFGETALPPTEIVAPSSTADPAHGMLDKSKLQPMLAAAQLMNTREDYFYITADDQQLCIDTSLDLNLQNYLYGKMNTAHARQIAMVVLDPDSGQVKAMVGYDKHDPAANTCLDNGIPAASVFKIVTAAAAIDTFDFSPETVFLFNGAKHTLYKRQLLEKKNRYTNRITLKQSFAQSVNPVFGKLGTHHLGRENLEKYSLAFGFNQHFAFELPLGPSRFAVSDDPYHWAELACGFNRSTTISPLHGALMAATIANAGELVEPTVIDRVTDARGRIVYSHLARKRDRIITPDTSAALERMMEATIRSGTCRKEFRGSRRDKVLSRLTIGGKSGSISNRAHDTRYDWFVGYAEEKAGTGKIAVAVLVAHEAYIGLRAAYYARLAIRHYFDAYFFNVDAGSGDKVTRAGVS